MRVLSLSTVTDLPRELAKLHGSQPAWALLYGVEGSPFADTMNALRRVYASLPVFGTSSFQGVFTQRGFERGMTLLVADRDDAVAPAVALEATSADQARNRAQAACRKIQEELGTPPRMLLLHATPGFEERILAGVRDVFGKDVPVYGGSAADNTLSGNWRVFANGTVCDEGFLLVGLFSAPEPPWGDFMGGYLPTGQHRDGDSRRRQSRVRDRRAAGSRRLQYLGERGHRGRAQEWWQRDDQNQPLATGPGRRQRPGNTAPPIGSPQSRHRRREGLGTIRRVFARRPDHAHDEHSRSVGQSRASGRSARPRLCEQHTSRRTALLLRWLLELDARSSRTHRAGVRPGARRSSVRRYRDLWRARHVLRKSGKLARQFDVLGRVALAREPSASTEHELCSVGRS